MRAEQNIEPDLDELILNRPATRLFWSLFYFRVFLFFAILPVVFTVILEIATSFIASDSAASILIEPVASFAFWVAVVLIVLMFFMAYFEGGIIARVAQLLQNMLVMIPIGFLYDLFFQTPRMFVGRVIESNLRLTERPDDCMKVITVLLVLAAIVAISWLSFSYWLPLYEAMRDEQR